MTSEATQVRPEAPTRVSTMFVPLLVAIGLFVLGGAFAGLAYGLLWGVIGTVAILASLRLGGIEIGMMSRAVLGVGITVSTVLAVSVLPSAPETMDVVLCLIFASAWIPAAISTAWVSHRRGNPPSASTNVAVAWLLTGAFALPAAQTFGILQPLDTLRRGVESDFGRPDYMIVALIMAAVGVATFLAAMSRLPSLAVISTVAIFTFFAAASVGFSIGALVSGFGNIVRVPNFWPPDFAWAIGEGTWWWLPSWEFGAPLRTNPLVETIRMGVIATILGCLVALPLAFLASNLTSINRKVYLTTKAFLNVTRTIPDLFWAVLLVASVGTGPFAGAIALSVFAMAIMSKLFSETIDDADPGPLEAAKATGSAHGPAVRSSVLPQVMASYVSYCLYIFELTIRASAIVGLVGAGGIGRVIEAQRVFYRFDRILAIILLIIVLVFILDQVSSFLRRRLV